MDLEAPKVEAKEDVLSAEEGGEVGDQGESESTGNDRVLLTT